MNEKEWGEFNGKFPRICASIKNQTDLPTEFYRSYERIICRLEENWGTPQGCGYFDDLLLTQRPGRRGFNTQVATELMRLNRLHMSLCPDYYRNPHDPFTQFR